MSTNAWNLQRDGSVLRVAVSREVGTSDLEALLKAVLIEVRGGARDIVLGGPGIEHPTSAATAFIRLLLQHRRKLGISVTLDPPQDLAPT